MFTLQHNRITQIRAAVLILFLGLAAGFFFYPRMISKTFGSESAQPEATPPRRRSTAQTRKPKYSEFPHNLLAHKKDCNSCHKFPSPNWKQVRKGDAAFPDITDYPRHESCLNCHRQQFFKGNPPQICTICHTNPGPRNSNRHPFPNPREIFDLSKKGQTAVSDFEIFFPHDKHIDIVSENKTDETGIGEVRFVKAGLNLRKAQSESCSVCHQTLNPQGDSEDEYFTKPPAKLGDAFWLKKGTFKTVPTSHEKCFQCHSQESGMLPAPTSCNTCHKLKQPEGKTDFDAKFATLMSVNDKIMITAWRKRDSSATFRHEWFSHNELACTTCHNVNEMNTTIAQTKKVKVISCGGEGSGCHITPTLDDGGALNFEVDARKSNPNFQCAKCHISYGKSPIPASHVEAISKMAAK